MGEKFKILQTAQNATFKAMQPELLHVAIVHAWLVLGSLLFLLG